MSLSFFSSKSRKTQTDAVPDWIERFSQNNLAYGDYLTKNVLNRHGVPPGLTAGDSVPSEKSAGGDGASAMAEPPSSYIAPFSKDTTDSFEMTRKYARGSTPDDLR